jgi:hypothetical protein
MSLNAKKFKKRYSRERLRKRDRSEAIEAAYDHAKDNEQDDYDYDDDYYDIPDVWMIRWAKLLITLAKLRIKGVRQVLENWDWYW